MNDLEVLSVNSVSKKVELPNKPGSSSGSPSSNSTYNADSRITILKNIELSIKQGESIAIIGASGSGKSTLLALLAGLDLPTSGSIVFEQQALQLMNEEQRAALRRSKIGFIFQQFLLVPSLTALENVMLPAQLSDHSHIRKQAKQSALTWLAKVGLSHRTSHFPNQLSGGEQQRVAIARAFITQPSLMFADEPSANLDSDNGKLIEDLLFSLNQDSDNTLVIVTHDKELAKRCDRCLLLSQGILEPYEPAGSG